MQLPVTISQPPRALPNHTNYPPTEGIEAHRPGPFGLTTQIGGGKFVDMTPTIWGRIQMRLFSLTNVVGGMDPWLTR